MSREMFYLLSSWWCQQNDHT